MPLLLIPINFSLGASSSIFFASLACRLRIFRCLVPDFPSPGGVNDWISRKAPLGRRWGGMIGNAGVVSSEDEDEDDDDVEDEDADEEELADEEEDDEDDEDEEDGLDNLFSTAGLAEAITGSTPPTSNAGLESTSTFLLFPRPEPSSTADAVTEADLFFELPALSLTLPNQSCPDYASSM
jgi:hypothetical protein